ncbi:MAG: hypothetical protein IPJ88_04380 [Myxococcales bacterium]|nr:MAG: hypothetical protein IPJ88_04380 [Myxococcales bacterium]
MKNRVGLLSFFVFLFSFGLGCGGSSAQQQDTTPNIEQQCPCKTCKSCATPGSCKQCQNCPHKNEAGKCPHCAKNKGMCTQGCPASKATVTEETQRASLDSCPNPANHCLEAGILFVGKKEFDRDYVYVEPAKQLSQADTKGEAKFQSVRTGNEFQGKHVYRTKAANPKQLGLGKLVILPFNKRQRLQQGPKSREDAYQTRWWLTRIVGMDDIDEGFVTVAGGHKVNVNALRLIEGDDSPAVTLAGSEDGDFLTPNHVFIADSDIPEVGFIFAHAGVVLKDSKSGKPTVLRLADGWTGEVKHVYSSQKASQDDLKKGVQVIMPYEQQNGIFIKAQNEETAHNKRWWIAKIVDTSELDKGFIKVNKGYRVSVDAVRLIEKK